MYQMYALGARVWNSKWGPLPGERGCRLRRDQQDDQWRRIIEIVRNSLTEEGWTDEPADLLGIKIVQVLEQNSGVSLDTNGQCSIPRKIRVEFGIPTTARATRTARALLAELEQKAGRQDARGGGTLAGNGGGSSLRSDDRTSAQGATSVRML